MPSKCRLNPAISAVTFGRSFLTTNFYHRRLIGRRFDDPTVKKDIESWPFTIIDDGGNPKIEVEYLGEKKAFSAQEISAMVLLKASPIL